MVINSACWNARRGFQRRSSALAAINRSRAKTAFGKSEMVEKYGPFSAHSTRTTRKTLKGISASPVRIARREIARGGSDGTTTGSALIPTLRPSRHPEEASSVLELRPYLSGPHVIRG